MSHGVRLDQEQDRGDREQECPRQRQEDREQEGSRQRQEDRLDEEQDLEDREQVGPRQRQEDRLEQEQDRDDREQEGPHQRQEDREQEGPRQRQEDRLDQEQDRDDREQEGPHQRQEDRDDEEQDREDRDAEDEVRDLPSELKARDPLYHVRVGAVIDGDRFIGWVKDIEVAVSTGERLYLVEWNDNEEQHCTADEVRSMQVRATADRTGQRVRVEGLRSRPDLNGREGVLENFEPITKR